MYVDYKILKYINYLKLRKKYMQNFKSKKQFFIENPIKLLKYEDSLEVCYFQM